MYRLKSCVDFKPYEGEKTFIKFVKRNGCVSGCNSLSIAVSFNVCVHYFAREPENIRNTRLSIVCDAAIMSKEVYVLCCGDMKLAP